MPYAGTGQNDDGIHKGLQAALPALISKKARYIVYFAFLERILCEPIPVPVVAINHTAVYLL